MTNTKIPETVNYHLNKNCNFRCKSCYATFNEAPSTHGAMLPREQMFAVVAAIGHAAHQGSHPVIDPPGRFFGRRAGRHKSSGPIPRIGLERVLPQGVSDREQFEERSGSYDFLKPKNPRMSPDIPKLLQSPIAGRIKGGKEPGASTEQTP